MKLTFFSFLLLTSFFIHAQSSSESLQLPSPTGPYTVGVTTFHWVDASRLEYATEDTMDYRQFAADVYYPGIRKNESTRAYFPHLELFLAGFKAHKVPAPRKIDEFSRAFSSVKTDSYENIPVDRSGGLYPVIFISPGGDMSRHWHTAMAQEYTSRGYLVVVVSHPHSGIDFYPLGGVVRKKQSWLEAVPELNAIITRRMTEDVIFAADRMEEINGTDSDHFLKNSMDLERIAIVGHSRGGRSVNCVLDSDERFLGGVRLDGTGPFLKLSRPHMTIRTPWKNPEKLAKIKRVHTNSTVTNYEVIIEGINHFSFSDLTLVATSYFPPKMDPVKGHFQFNQIVLQFVEALFQQKNLDAPLPLNVEELSKAENVQVIVHH